MELLIEPPSSLIRSDPLSYNILKSYLFPAEDAEDYEAFKAAHAWHAVPHGEPRFARCRDAG